MSFQLLAAGNDSMRWIVYAIGALAIVYLVLRPLAKKKDPLSGVPKFSLSKERTIEREMNNVLVELSQLARQVSAQLDTRSAKLEVLMQDADQRIAELKRLATSPLALGESGEGAALRQVEKNSDDLIFPPDPRHKEIYALADAGRSVAEIAQKLKRPRGEVELILALRMH